MNRLFMTNQITATSIVKTTVRNWGFLENWKSTASV